jgi:hypothetical protein
MWINGKLVRARSSVTVRLVRAVVERKRSRGKGKEGEATLSSSVFSLASHSHLQIMFPLFQLLFFFSF